MVHELESAAEFNVLIHVLVRELLTEKKPFDHHRDWNQFLIAVGDEGERPIIPSSCPPSLFSLIEDCWRNDASLRYAF